ncbi:MAG TPA: 4Fe-4S binding protein [Thermoflexia bacterium]|nr:4Fe-4S binding protein [Thermoflexia bacterium]
MKVYARTPLGLAQVQVPRGQVYIIPERCKGCEICIEFCPQAVLQESEAVNAKGYHYPEIVPGKEGACIHCGFCTIICPEFAIFSADDGELSFLAGRQA